MKRSFARSIDLDKPFMDHFRDEHEILMRGIGAAGEPTGVKTGTVVGLVLASLVIGGVVGYASRNAEVRSVGWQLSYAERRRAEAEASATRSNNMFNDVYSEKVRGEIKDDEARERDRAHSADAVLANLGAEPDLGESRSDEDGYDDRYSGGY